MLAAATMIMSGCNGNNNQSAQTMSNISEETVGRTVQAIVEKCPQADRALVQKGVAQAAALWRTEDGTEAEFEQFAAGSYAATPEDRKVLFDKLSAAFETLYGTSNQVAVRLQAPLQLAGPEPTEIDYILGAFSPYSHLSDDLFANKTAFVTILNFPFYTLEEKNTLGKEWSRLEWAYARMGDAFTTRVPASVNAGYSKVSSAAENYIASYNIMMGHLLTDDGGTSSPMTAAASSPRTWCCSRTGTCATSSRATTLTSPMPTRNRR